MNIKLPKKQVLIGILFALIILAGILVYFLFFQSGARPDKEAVMQDEIERQFQELQANRTPLTEEEITKQMEELNSLGSPALSEEEINKQFEELTK